MSLENQRESIKPTTAQYMDAEVLTFIKRKFGERWQKYCIDENIEQTDHYVYNFDLVIGLLVSRSKLSLQSVFKAKWSEWLVIHLSKWIWSVSYQEYQNEIIEVYETMLNNLQDDDKNASYTEVIEIYRKKRIIEAIRKNKWILLCPMRNTLIKSAIKARIQEIIKTIHS